jgi:hypothetical protein
MTRRSWHHVHVAEAALAPEARRVALRKSAGILVCDGLAESYEFTGGELHERAHAKLPASSALRRVAMLGDVVTLHHAHVQIRALQCRLHEGLVVAMQSHSAVSLPHSVIHVKQEFQ